MDIERLLAEQRWLARLAQRLVGDADLAADLTQTTLARALERPPSGERSIRGWLATVLRRETARHLRRDAERPGREGTAANDALAPATDALVERVATQRELARLVLELPTAQREVLLLSFWEGLPPRAVARRLGLELESVKSRKKRALARLRERLDSEYGGDRGAWMAALAPLAWPHEVALAPLAERTSNGTPGAFPTTSATLGTALMSSTLIKIALSTSLVAGTALLVLGPGSGESGPARPAPPSVASTTTHDDLQGVEPEASRRDHDAQTAVRREALAAPGPSSESTAEPLGTLPVGTTPLSGIAVDPVGAPLDGLRVRANGEGARTDRQGRFALASASDGPVELDEAGWTTVFAARRAPSSSIAPAMLIGAPEAVFEGQVVDARSNPVPNAWVEYLLTDAARLTIEADLDHTEERRWSTEAGPDGTFRLTAPGMEGGVLRAVADGHPSRVVDAPTRSAGGLTIRLANPQDARRYLAGRVVDASGLPVPGARVTHGLEVVTCDGDGRFELDLRDPEGLNVAWGERTGDDAAPTEISAFAFGFLPGSMRAELDADGEPGWPAEVVLILGGPPLTIEGRVVDPSGDPVAGAELWIADATLMGSGLDRAIVLETAIADSPDGFAPQVESDGDGRFRFEGLVDRPYTIEATHPKTMARAAPLTVAAGTNDAVLRLPGPEAVFSRVRGRVVDSEGNPVPDVRLTLATDTAQVRYRGHVFSTRHGRRDDRVTTGEDGHFEFRDVPRRAVYLRLDGPRVVSRDWGRDTFALEEWLDDPLDVVLEVGLRRRFQVHLADPARADALSVLDSDGNPLSISLIMGNSRRDGPRMQIEGGKTGVLTVADTASMLVLYRGQQEVERLPIELGDSDVETLDL